MYLYCDNDVSLWEWQPYVCQYGQDYTMQLIVDGSNIIGRLWSGETTDGEPDLTLCGISSMNLDAMGIGLEVSGATAYFDNVHVFPLSIPLVKVPIPPAGMNGVFEYSGFHYLASPDFAVAIDTGCGLIAGIWDRIKSERIVTNSFLLYDMQTSYCASLPTDERFDMVTNMEVTSTDLTLVCANSLLPGVKLKKIYSFAAHPAASGRIVARRLDIEGNVSLMTLLKVTSRTLFDPDFRNSALYHRLAVAGARDDTGFAYCSTVLASNVTKAVQQNAWFFPPQGRAQFVLHKPGDDRGLAEYLYKVNGQWAYPEAMSSSYWTTDGWDMGFCQTFVTSRAYSAEHRFHLYRGDHVNFHREYLASPEYVALRAGMLPSPKVSKVAANYCVTVWGTLDADDPKVVNLLTNAVGGLTNILRPDELCGLGNLHFDNHWPNFPSTDGTILRQTTDTDQGTITIVSAYADCQRKQVAFAKQLNSNFLYHIYSWILDISEYSHAYVDHPEWIARDRRGNPLPGYFGTGNVMANFSPEFVDYLTNRLIAMVD